MKQMKLWMLAALLTLCGVATAQAQGVSYVERSWDETNKQVVSTTRTCSSYTAINGNDTSDGGWVGLYSGWYVVTGNSEYKAINVLGDDVHLIIPDGMTLNVTHIKLESGYKLSIYGQGGGTGKLVANNADGISDAAGIGGGDEACGGVLVVQGGIVEATGNKYGAGIGGGDKRGFAQTPSQGGLFVYGGSVKAQGGQYAAGIGSGDENVDGTAGYVIIYGGTVNATGGDEGAGIGGGNDGHGAMFSIYGGTVTAKGGRLGAGIGGGDEGDGGQPSFYGGTVTATGDYHGAGIGGGENGHGGYINIYGGNIAATGGEHGAGIGGGDDGGGGTICVHEGNSVVVATGGEGGAGIGGGYNSGYGGNYVTNEDGNSGTITIEGGNVTATSISSAAGIGGGIDGHYCKVNISGGTVTAISKHDGAGIGSGAKADGSGMYVDLDITISGGTVTTYSEGHGPGIGVGAGFHFAYREGDIKGGEIKITGGTVIAGDASNSFYGTGAGIGTAGFASEDTSHMYGSIIISGGNVTASSNTGAGIGPGQGCKIHETGLIWITGGTVKASSATCSAIGRGKDVDYSTGGGSESSVHTALSENAGTVMIQGGTVELSSGTDYHAVYINEQNRLQLANALMVKNNGTKVGCNDRVSTLVGMNSTVKVEPCTHSAVGDDYSCLYCLSGSITTISLADDADNSEVITGYNGKTVSVTLQGRTLYKDGSWNTLCLPFDVTVSGSALDGATVKTLSSTTFDDGTLTLNFEDASTLEAGKPYIVKWASGADFTPTFTGVTISTTETTDVTGTAANFHGIYSPYATGGANTSMLYLGASNTLYYPNAAMTINAFRAYFTLNGIEAGDPTSPSPAAARRFVLNFGDGDETTGILSLSADSKDAMDNAAWYTLDGRRLTGKPSRAGVYINNGKKIVIK